jgi:arabinogalactan endo-1,4-beta-galactosidase
MKKLLSILISLTIVLGFSTTAFASSEKVNIEKIEFKNPDFIKGMDISSVISLENSGVSFKNFNNEKEDLLKILSDNGVNCIRIRVWNNPFDKDGNGYGGGNNDIDTAVKIAERAAKYKLKLLIDFHYSDFWADPAKQKAPKEWENLTLAQKTEKVKEFTKSSLKKIEIAGGEVAMVQIGNETTNGIAGEYSKDNMAEIYKAGSSAVREFNKDIKIAVHFTNPENTEYIKSLADYLNEYKIDYDVFSTSYYPYWHGSLRNLTEVLNYAAEKYGKYVMVAETSYANTLDDTDGHANTVSRWSNCTGENLLWDFSYQGQAEELRAVMNAVNNVDNGKGLGVFYWEGAWISVGDTTGLGVKAYSERLENNKKLWEEFGSGWASSYSKEFDPDDAGKYFGGSAVDNQSFFGADGKALPSLRVFDYVSFGDGEILLGDADGNGKVNILDTTVIQKHISDGYSVNKKAADIDGDKLVTIKDATLIQKYRVKMKVDYPINTDVN